eukprot:1883073-Pleurochrysis_carterae.AAC.1
MITGDSKETAVAIAKEVGIFDPAATDLANKTYAGGEFFELERAVQDELLTSSNLVFCRAEPQDKQRLVRQLQALGEVAAMTGDGVNDAPALQQARNVPRRFTLLRPNVAHAHASARAHAHAKDDTQKREARAN